MDYCKLFLLQRLLLFLPSKESAGYFSDKGILSKEFVLENIFFQILTVWGTFYFDEILFHNKIKANVIGRLVEAVMIFLPFTLIRPYFPLTRLRDAYFYEKDKSEQNLNFYRIVIIMIKIFYIWSKHFMGFYLSYLRYLDVIDGDYLYWVHHMLLSNIGTASIAIFLHTLRFKKIIGPRIAQVVYVIMAYQSFIGGMHLIPLFLNFPILLLMATFGCTLNYFKRDYVHYYYVAAMGVILLIENQYIPLFKVDVLSFLK